MSKISRNKAYKLNIHKSLKVTLLLRIRIQRNAGPWWIKPPPNKMYVHGGMGELLEVRQQGMESENGDSINEWRVRANHGPYSSLEYTAGRAAPEFILYSYEDASLVTYDYWVRG